MALDTRFSVIGEYVLLPQCSIGWTRIDDGQCRRCTVEQPILRASQMGSIWSNSDHTWMGVVSAFSGPRHLHIGSSQTRKKSDCQYCNARFDIDTCNLFGMELHHFGIGRNCSRFAMGRFCILEMNE